MSKESRDFDIEERSIDIALRSFERQNHYQDRELETEFFRVGTFRWTTMRGRSYSTPNTHGEETTNELELNNAAKTRFLSTRSDAFRP